MTCNTINTEEKLSKRIATFLCSAQNELTLNISRMNFIEASRAAILGSTKCYVENPEKRINWIVKDEQTRSAIVPFMLDNMEVITRSGN